MTSRFVSGGMIEGDNQGGPSGATAEGNDPAGAGSNAVEWEKVQKELDEERRKRAESRRAAVEGGVVGGERSLYEVLQANKAAKQAAFEEANRIRNQFRSLDDDEIEFLEGVQEERKAEEDRRRRETEEGLAGFRKAQMSQQNSGVVAPEDDREDVPASEDWGIGAGRKRKRDKDKDKVGFKGLKRRVSGDEGEKKAKKNDDGDGGDKRSGIVDSTKTDADSGEAADGVRRQDARPNPVPKEKPKLGLVEYGSDEDDDD